MFDLRNNSIVIFGQKFSERKKIYHDPHAIIISEMK